MQVMFYVEAVRRNDSHHKVLRHGPHWPRVSPSGDGGANCQLFGCPEDWTVYRGACYKFVSATALWSDAEDSCQALKEGAHQTSIHSAGEVKLLSDMVVSFYGFGPGHSGFVFVGMSCSRTGPELLCQWTDGSPVVYAQWADEQIEGDGQFYVRSRMPPGRLYLDNAVHTRPYFCKHKL